jgi:CrcB protein
VPTRGTRTLLAVFAGGMAGTLARAGLVEAWPPHAGHWPWATFAVNVAGSALLGRVAAGERHHRLLGAGFCGALTTFSTFQLELLHMADADRPLLAVGYAAASVAACLVAVAAAGRRRAA